LPTPAHGKKSRVEPPGQTIKAPGVSAEQEVEGFLLCKREEMNAESQELIDEWIAELRSRKAA
jgi:hypothetical protein